MRKSAYALHQCHYKTNTFVYRESIPEKQDTGLDKDIYDIIEDAVGKELPATEVRKFSFYKDVGKFEREIAQLMKSSKTTIYNDIIRKNDSNEMKLSGRKTKLTARE